MLKPVTMPVQLLNLKNVKLSEKLLLALYASDPGLKPVRRTRLILNEDGSA